MQLTAQVDPKNLRRVFVLEIHESELIRVPLTAADRLVLQDCESSDSVADKLLALELIARKIEQSSDSKPSP